MPGPGWCRNNTMHIYWENEVAASVQTEETCLHSANSFQFLPPPLPATSLIGHKLWGLQDPIETARTRGGHSAPVSCGVQKHMQDIPGLTFHRSLVFSHSGKGERQWKDTPVKYFTIFSPLLTCLRRTSLRTSKEMLSTQWRNDLPYKNTPWEVSDKHLLGLLRNSLAAPWNPHVCT